MSNSLIGPVLKLSQRCPLEKIDNHLGIRFDDFRFLPGFRLLDDVGENKGHFAYSALLEKEPDKTPGSKIPSGQKVLHNDRLTDFVMNKIRRERKDKNRNQPWRDW